MTDQLPINPLYDPEFIEWNTKIVLVVIKRKDQQVLKVKTINRVLIHEYSLKLKSEFPLEDYTILVGQISIMGELIDMDIEGKKPSLPRGEFSFPAPGKPGEA